MIYRVFCEKPTNDQWFHAVIFKQCIGRYTRCKEKLHEFKTILPFLLKFAAGTGGGIMMHNTRGKGEVAFYISVL